MILLAACSAHPPIPVTPTRAGPSVPATPEVTQGPVVDDTLTATSSGPVDVYDGPGGELAATLHPEEVALAGNPLTFLVKDVENGWLHVMLPTRPNGSMGWIDGRHVVIGKTRMEIVVDLSDRELTLFEGGVAIESWPVAIGEDVTPTPVGRFYLLEKVRPPEGSIYGAYALGLSAHSEVLEEFKDGPARIGIHGTNQPELIGQAVSNGCIRMSNADIAELVEEYGIPNGSPVEVRP